MKRVVSIWFPRLATDRLCRATPAWRDRPLATATVGGVRRIVAVNGPAHEAGLRSGRTVADALALVPGLTIVPADPDGERQLLDHLADWCGHYTPWTAADGWAEGVDGGGLWLDITGCAHLFGGEQALLAHLGNRLDRLGFAHRLGLADTPGAAWAWARFGNVRDPVLPPGGQRDALERLPTAALRLRPPTVAGLSSLGLRRVGDLYGLARAATAARFGREVAHRLDQALGVEAEPVSPRRPPAQHRVHATFAEPIARTEDVVEAVRRLLVRFCAQLGQERLGVRRLELLVFKVDASAQRLAVGTSRPVRDVKHLMRLLAGPIDTIDAGFGIEALRLSALELAAQEAEQADIEAATPQARADDLARLLDSLGNRLGFDRISRPALRESHLPERAVQRLSSGDKPKPVAWSGARRPLRLFSRPEPVEAIAPVPDSPPLTFRWRRISHRVVRADGAERIASEWWRRDTPERDYYLVEDERGRRFWLYREGLYGSTPAPRWYLHGLFS